MLRLICYIRAIPFWIRTGEWIPHVFEEEKEEMGDVFVTPTSFRVAGNDYRHDPGEVLVKDVKIKTYRCKDCGFCEQVWERTRF